MAIRMSGMNSGLDTEAIVSAMVMNYTAKVTKNQQAQTKLSYKQEALKDINSDVYNLFTSVDKLRFSSAYSLKTTSVSDTTKAKVTAANNATNGTQTLNIKELAQAGYLTGGKVKSNGTLSTGSKLSDIYTTSGADTNTFSGGSFTVTKGDGTKINIDMSKDGMTAQDLVNQLKDAGLNASFDPDNGRFFISSKASGKDNDFVITSNDADGMKSLKALGLYTKNAKATAEYQKWASYDITSTAFSNLVDEEFAKIEVSYDKKAESYAKAYNDANKAYKAAENDMTVLKGAYELAETASDADLKKLLSERLDGLKDGIELIRQSNPDAFTVRQEEKKNADGEVEKDADGNPIMVDVIGEDGKPVYDVDVSKLSEENKTKYNDLSSKMKSLESDIKKFDSLSETKKDQTDAMAKNLAYVDVDADGNATAVAADSAKGTALAAELAIENKNSKDALRIRLENKVTENQALLVADNNSTDSEGAVPMEGKDAVILLNGAEFTSSSNTFNINGLSIEATAKTQGEITITTATDNQGIYDKIKDFLSQYNDVINKINKLYNAPSAKGYEPLTEDQKSAMSDTEVEKWEKKIKGAILRRDDTLSGIIQSLNSNMSKVIGINGKNFSLGTFGISTLGIFGSAVNEQYAFHIDGDTDDKNTSGNTDKLMAAITKDPDTVINFFQQLTQGVYDGLNAKMKSTTLSSAYTIYNDKEMASEYSDYTSTISKWQDKVADMEQRYFKKFTAMEKALASLNSQTSVLSGYFG